MICVVCSDDKDVKKHYGVNCCYGCKGFFRRTVNEEKNYTCSNGGNCPVLKDPSLNLVNFLSSMAKRTLEVHDPEYETVQPHEWSRISQEKCNREISLIEGIKNPEKVCPRTKWDFSYSRPASNLDIAFMWYRSFVAVVDWAKNIPEFRMLLDEDQAQLLRLNFTTLSFMVFSQSPVEINSEILPLGNGSYVGGEGSGLKDLYCSIMGAYIQHIVNPLKEVDTDPSEFALLSTIHLFQYFEGLSPEGRKIAKNYVDSLYDAFFDYQILRFPKASAKERTRRQTKILMIIAKMPQIWAAESDIHLMLSTFNEVNIDGIPKELLFYRFGVRT
ncbi:hypothetical protein FO519_006941 [Halicephalobus sp. NKZ332]|nr:hypothetical protein FO519_006941 [Halicephalobus sp. NKZ332]